MVRYEVKFYDEYEEAVITEGGIVEGRMAEAVQKIQDYYGKEVIEKINLGLVDDNCDEGDETNLCPDKTIDELLLEAAPCGEMREYLRMLEDLGVQVRNPEAEGQFYSVERVLSQMLFLVRNGDLISKAKILDCKDTIVLNQNQENERVIEVEEQVTD